jgi:Zn-dependent protease
MKSALTLFSVRSVPIRLHYSWLLIAPWFASGFGDQLRAGAVAANIDPSQLSLPIWAWGCLLTLLLAVSVTLHELGHVWMARRYGARVDGITLLMFGGVSYIGPVDDPRAGWRIAIAGPVVSVALALGFGLLAGVSIGAPPDVALALHAVAAVNAMLAVFNLLPAFPMDGGRVLQGALARRLGPARATRVAAAIGGVLAIALGAWALSSGQWWLALIAIYLFLGGRSEVAALERSAPPSSTRPA